MPGLPSDHADTGIHGDRWLLLWAVVGSWLLAPVLPGVAATWLGPIRGVLGFFAVLLCPIILLISGWDLIRRPPTPWLGAALTLSVLNVILLGWVLARAVSVP